MKKGSKSPDEMTFLEHLEELRKRIVRSVIALIIIVIPCWTFHKQLFQIIERPLKQFLPVGKKLAFINLTEPFILYIKVCFLAAVFITAPYIFYQIWLFVAPGLFKKEKKYTIPFIIFTTFFFILGALFAYYIAFPFACGFFLKLGADFEPVITANKYFSLAIRIILKSHPDRLTAYIPAVLGFALASRGWDHLRGTVFPHVTPSLGPPKFWDYDPKYAKVVTDREHIDTAADSLEICKWLTEFELMEEGLGGVSRMAELLSALTGLDFSEKRLHKACDRIYNIERGYLVKHGIRREDDVAPHHFYEMPIPDGPSKGKTLDRGKFEELKDVFYEWRGSDKKTGAPKRETLEELGLKYVADELEEIGVYEEGK